jgi:hypothetical protein
MCDGAAVSVFGLAPGRGKLGVDVGVVFGCIGDLGLEQTGLIIAKGKSEAEKDGGYVVWTGGVLGHVAVSR